MKKTFLFTVLFAFTMSKLHAQKMSSFPIKQLSFLGEYDVPYKQSFLNTTIGGLSGIDYDPNANIYYLISDDRSSFNPARFYTARIYFTAKGIDSVQFVNVINILQPNGETYPNSVKDPAHTPDPESMRYNVARKELVWSSEGERIVRPGKIILEDPAVTAVTTTGKYIDTFVLPANMHMHAIEKGPRQNGVFEGLTFADHYKTLYVNVEEPIYEDGPRAGLGDTTGWIRIIKFNAVTRKPLAQYAYQIDPVAYPPVPAGSFRINGVPDILWLGNDQLLVTERSFSTGRNACVIRLYQADLMGATDVKGVSSVYQNHHVHPVKKSLLLNMDSLGIYIDNIEGATFGPMLPNGHKTLIFVSDDNFSKEQKTQFLLFEVIPSPAKLNIRHKQKPGSSNHN